MQALAEAAESRLTWRKEGREKAVREAASMETVSIVVPVYNTEAYVERCIRSLLSQTYSSVEIWAVDDGSTDGSPAVLERLEKEDARMHYLRVPHGGVSAARNAALAQVSGAYLGFLDSDDWLESNTLECLVRDMEAHRADVVFFNSTWEGPAGARLRVAHPKTGEADTQELLHQALCSQDEIGAECGYFLGVTNKLFRVSSITAQHGALPLFDPEVSMLEDGLWLMQSLPGFSKGYLNGRGFYHRTYRPDSATGSDARWVENTVRYTRSYVRVLRIVRERAGDPAVTWARDSLFGTLENALRRDAAETGGQRMERLLEPLDEKSKEELTLRLLRTGIAAMESESYKLGQKLYRHAPVRKIYQWLKARKQHLQKRKERL